MVAWLCVSRSSRFWVENRCAQPGTDSGIGCHLSSLARLQSHCILGLRSTIALLCVPNVSAATTFKCLKKVEDRKQPQAVNQ